MSDNASRPTLYSDISLQSNRMTLDFCRSSFSAITGITAGILGLTSFPGFIFYFVSYLSLTSIIWMFKAERNTQKYFRSWSELWIDGMTGGVFSYVLFWTLLYGIIRIY